MIYDDLALLSQQILVSLQSNYEGRACIYFPLHTMHFANRVETSPTALHKRNSQQDSFYSLLSISIEDVCG